MILLKVSYFPFNNFMFFTSFFLKEKIIAFLFLF